MGEAELGEALAGADLVVIPAGVPRKPGMTRDDLFKINAGIVKGLVTAVAKHCPGAWINMISNPVNSTVPIAAETLKARPGAPRGRGRDACPPRKRPPPLDSALSLCTCTPRVLTARCAARPQLHGVYDPKKLFGVTTLDVVRARTFLAARKGLDVAKVDVPVVGGHAGITILPLFSKATPATALGAEETDALTKRTQDGGTEVVAAKAGKGSATLSMAYAGALFADACLRAMAGEKGVAEYCYVQSPAAGHKDVTFFATRVLMGRGGAEVVDPVPSGLTAYEEAALAAMLPELADSIAKGVAFVKENP